MGSSLPEDSGSSSTNIRSIATVSGFLDEGKHIKDDKVARDDIVRVKMRFPLLERFRILLGVSGFAMGGLKSSADHTMTHGLSPTPVPLEDDENPAPAQPLHQTQKAHSHSQLRNLRHVPPVQDLEARNGNGSNTRAPRIIIAGAMLVTIGLIMALLCLRHQRSKKNRLRRKIPVTSIPDAGGGYRGFKNSNPSNAINNVSFDPALELFHLNSFHSFRRDGVASSYIRNESAYANVESVSIVKKSPQDVILYQTNPRESLSAPIVGKSPTLEPLTGAGNVPKPPPPPSPPSMSSTFKKSDSGKNPPLSTSTPSVSSGNILKPPVKTTNLLHPYTPVGKDGTPLPKLKPLHWDKVRAAPECSMVWDKIRSSSFELDEEMIKTFFGCNLPSSVKNEEVKNKSSSPCKHILKPKRLQNLTILLKATNATTEQVCDCLLKGTGLTAQQLEALLKMVPTKEEEEKLVNHERHINDLGSAEKFLKAILCIPFSFTRIEVMLYRETFEDEVVHLRKSFEMLEEACKELRSSRLFLLLLEAVLKTGNRMNVGTRRGGARAFKLDALLKLADVKGTDGKTTLLHFVVQELIRSEGISASDMATDKASEQTLPDDVEGKEEAQRIRGLQLVLGLSTELCNVKKTASMDLDVLSNSVAILSDGMDKMRHLIEQDLSIAAGDTNRSFVHLMTSFLNQAKRSIKELKDDEDRVNLHLREVTEYFHGDRSMDRVNPLQIFVIVRDFLVLLDPVCKEIRNSQNPANSLSY